MKRSGPVTEPAFKNIDALLDRLDDLWSRIEVTRSQGAFLYNSDPALPRAKIRVPSAMMRELFRRNLIEQSPAQKYHPPTREIYQARNAGDRSLERYRILRARRAARSKLAAHTPESRA